MEEFLTQEQPSSVASCTVSSTSPSPSQTSKEPDAIPLAPSSGLPPLPVGKSKSGERTAVWDHFEKYDEVTEVTSKEDGTKGKVLMKRARCKHCGTTYAADPVTNGTSNLNKHIKVQCKKLPGREPDKRQKTLSFDESAGGLVARGATNEDCLSACVEMVIVDELPFRFVEGRGFRKFCSVACPYFQVPSRRTLVRHFLTMYEHMKSKLKADLASRRVCLTTDTWTSCQNVNYMVITAHFIDDDWNLHKRVINFCVIPNHKGISIGKLLEQCLLEWGIEKLLTVTADNASTNTVAIDYLRGKMKHWTNAKMLLGGKYLHVRCGAHIVNLIVGKGLESLEKSVMAIRNAVKYVRSSPQRLGSFKTCVANEKIECKGLVVLDVPTRWNSTYLMLDAALKFEKAFYRLGEDDNCYLGWFGEDEEEREDGTIPRKPKKRVGPPNAQDWRNATIFRSFLKVFYDMTLKMSMTLHPAVHETFHDLISVEEEIKGLFIEDEMFVEEEDDDANSEARRVLNDMAERMMMKFGKYWGDLDKINQLLMVALVLDPRYKLGNLAHVLKMYCLDPESAAKKKDEIKTLLLKLFNEYVIPTNQCSGYNASGADDASGVGSATYKETAREPKGGRKRHAMTQGWIEEAAASNVIVLEHEVDRYIMDPIEKTDPDRDFDILSWWKHNGVKYPGLATVAKDILAIPVSTVASEACFSTGGRVVNPFRASLTPKMVEALICCQNWLISGDISSLQDAPSIEEMEFYESLEEEFLRISTTKASKAAPAIFC